MLSPEKAALFIKQSPNKKNGNSGGNFVPVKDGWGLKFFEDEGDRDSSYALQEKCAYYDAAPQVGDMLDFEMNGGRYFGYFTEVATIMGVELERITETNHNDYDFDWDIHTDAHDQLERLDEWEYMKNNLSAAGFDFYDDHLWNVGAIEDRLVCIDFI